MQSSFRIFHRCLGIELPKSTEDELDLNSLYGLATTFMARIEAMKKHDPVKTKTASSSSKAKSKGLVNDNTKM